jgi:hypothetical protein
MFKKCNSKTTWRCFPFCPKESLYDYFQQSIPWPRILWCRYGTLTLPLRTVTFYTSCLRKGVTVQTHRAMFQHTDYKTVLIWTNVHYTTVQCLPSTQNTTKIFHTQSAYHCCYQETNSSNQTADIPWHKPKAKNFALKKIADDTSAWKMEATQVKHTRHEVLKEVLHRNQVSWNMKLSHRVSSCWCFKGTQCLGFICNGLAVLLDFFIKFT